MSIVSVIEKTKREILDMLLEKTKQGRLAWKRNENIYSCKLQESPETAIHIVNEKNVYLKVLGYWNIQIVDQSSLDSMFLKTKELISIIPDSLELNYLKGAYKCLEMI